MPKHEAKVLICPLNTNGKTLKSFKIPSNDLFSDDFLIDDDGSIYEMVQFKEDFRSWFSDTLVLEDGSLIMISKIDPLYILLPYILKNRNLFKSTQDLISGDENCNSFFNAVSDSKINAEVICDKKTIDEVNYYRYNQTKAMQWLNFKLKNIVTCLKKAQIDVSPSTLRISKFVSGRKTQDFEENYQKYALDLMKYYLCPELIAMLQESLKIKSPTREETNIALKKGEKRSHDESSPIEDYFVPQNQEKSDSIKKQKTTKHEKQLKKEAQKSGQQKIFNFLRSKT